MIWDFLYNQTPAKLYENDHYEIFLLPNNQEQGNLETLIQNIATYPKILSCFECYKDCIKDCENPIKDPNSKKLQLPDNKAKIYAYFHCFGITYNQDLDSALLHKYINMESNYLENLKNYLIK